MKLESYLKKVNMKEIIICLSLIVIGYMTAQLFMRKYNGFRVGGQKCECTKTSGGDCVDGADSSKPRNSKFCTDQTTQNTCLSAGGRIGPGKFVGKNTCKWTPGPAPANASTSYNCNASKCVSVSGTSGTYSSESDCQSKCGGNTPPPPPPPTKYSCNASTNKCEPDSNGSYTNASNCQSDCDVSIWDFPANTFKWYSWPLLIVYFVGVIFIVLTLAFAFTR
jgi:hypothetical protein